MSSFINGSNNTNLFYIKEINDKDKLITKILINLESKLKIVEQHRNKFYSNNNIREIIIINKFEFLDLLNEFEETITQSLQGMRSLITEIKNLKDKNEFEDKLLKKQDKKIKIKNKINNLAKELYFDYSKEKSPKCLDISKKYENKFGKNKSFIQTKELNLYKNIYEPENNINSIKSNGNKNQIYLNKNLNNSTININSSNEMKKLNNYNTIDNINTNKTISDFHKNKVYSNNNNNQKKIISNDSIHEKEPLEYDLSLTKYLKKDQNQSTPVINYNDFNNSNLESNNNRNNINNKYRKILRLQIKNRNKNLNNSNADNLTKNNKNHSFSQKYELELQNTNEDKSEKIEVEIRCPIRQGLRKNFKRNSVRNQNYKCDSIFNRFNYNGIRKEIAEVINSNEKLKNYFAKKYGGNKYDSFLDKLWKNKLDINDISNEINIISTIIAKEKSYSPLQNAITKRLNNGRKNHKINMPDKNLDKRFINL